MMMMMRQQDDRLLSTRIDEWMVAQRSIDDGDRLSSSNQLFHGYATGEEQTVLRMTRTHSIPSARF